MKRHFLKTSLASGLALAAIFGAQPAANAEQPLQTTSQAGASSIQDNLSEGEKILAIGEDGFVRTVNTNDSGNHKRGEIRNDLKLAEGDAITLSKDKKTATLVDSKGTVLGEFKAPAIEVEGKTFDGIFKVDGSSLITGLPADSPLNRERSCWRGNAAKWTWRVAGAATCGATGVINVLGGAACGLAWAGAEDQMNIDERVCR